jgi:hypothetical protein
VTTATKKDPLVITDDELLAFNTARQQMELLEEQVKRARETFEEIETNLLNRIGEGSRFSGKLSARIEFALGRAVPRWKQVAMGLAERLAISFTVVEKEAQEDAKKNRAKKPYVFVFTK